MMIRICILTACTIILVLSWRELQAAASDTLSPAKYALVWADEFNYSGPPDSAYWSFEQGFARNHEHQWYQKENAWCENGLLIIEARRETRPNPNFQEGSSDWRKNRKTIDYTSSSIRTAGKISWQYGRFEMRAKIDTSLGLWPAWWTLGVKGRWPANGEIDIMEFYRGMLLANLACGTSEIYKAQWFTTKKKVASFEDKNWSQKFHIWRMDWSEEMISLFVDDMLLNQVAMKDLHNKDSIGINPFQQEHYMLLNLAIGGDNGGDPSGTSFPRRFEVDYVRVFRAVR